MRIYVAGPMTGLPEFNYPAFDAAAQDLRRRGYLALNPARRPVVAGWAWIDYMRLALADLLAADGVATLPGWRHSRGASLEVHVAERLGLPVRPVHDWPATR